MIYEVLLDGIPIWDEYPAMDLISPRLEANLNAAGSLEFTMTPDHVFYYDIWPLKGTVEVYEMGDLIWFGRPISLERDIDNHKTVYCEGSLAYFNDSVQTPRAEEEISPQALLADILAVHNGQVPANRQFMLGTVSMPATALAWENDYTDTWDSVNQMLDQFGGFLLPRRQNGVNYLDYVETLPQNEGQPVAYGKNLIGFQRTYSYEDAVTAVYPIGGVDEERFTIESVNNGSPILDKTQEGAPDIAPDVFPHVRIIKMMSFPDAETPEDLLAEAAAYLASTRIQPIVVDATAAELAFIDKSYTPFRIGYRYRTISEPHSIDDWLTITRLSLSLDKATKQVTMGSNHKRISNRSSGWDRQVNGVSKTRGTVNFVTKEQE